MKWYELKPKDKEVHNKLIPQVRKIRENQTYRRAENLMWARLYGNVDILGLSPSSYSRPNPVSNGVRPKFNVVASCIDTLAAKISKNRPRAFFLTDGGDWTLQAKAKKLQKFTDGTFYSAKTYEETDKAFVDTGTFGTGLVKVFGHEGKICDERTLCDEVIVDDAEAMYGNPPSLYHAKPYDRGKLIAMFPEFKAEIMDLPKVDEEFGYYNVTDADFVEVVEAWHLRSGKDAKDGRHAICVQNATLVYEEWNRKRFPFAKMTFRDRLAGWYGQGIGEIVMGTQVAINRILRNNDISQYLHQAPAWLVEENSAVVSAHLNNDIGHIVKYRGIPPELRTFAAVHPEMYQQVQVHIQRAYEEVGISALSAASQKPAGLDSGKAMQTYNDIESERFVKLGQKWEQFHLDICDLHLDEGRELSKTNPKLSVVVKSGSFTETINWSEVNMEDDKYQMQTFPTANLPRTPQARYAQVQEYVNSGWIDPEMGAELMEMPDIEQWGNLKFAGRRVTRQSVQKMVEDGEYIAPEPFQDLQYSIDYTQMFYNYAKLHGCPEDRLELLRRYMQQCFEMQKMATPPPPPMPAPQPTIPQPPVPQGV